VPRFSDGDASDSHGLTRAKPNVLLPHVGAERKVHLLPYRDENETQRTAIVTMALIGLDILSWFVVQGAGPTRWPGPSARLD
jgi:hypothetical protein